METYKTGGPSEQQVGQISRQKLDWKKNETATPDEYSDDENLGERCAG